MKKILSIFLLAAGTSYGQGTVVFHENFDLPSGADSITAGTTGGTNPTAGGVTTQLAVSPTQSYKMAGSEVNTTVYFETQSFSTVNQPFVKLQFSHIAKLVLSNSAFVEVSTDGGQSWSYVTASSYMGTDGLFINTGYFSGASYMTTSSAPWAPFNAAAIPTNNWWKNEEFDLTGIASDTANGMFSGYPNVKLRFIASITAKDPSTQQFAAGWFIDEIKVTTSNCEVGKPSLSFDIDSSSCVLANPEGNITYNSSNTYSLGVVATDSGTYATGIDNVTIFYSINGSAPSSINMIKAPGSSQYVADLTVNASDTVQYHIEVSDYCGNLNRKPEGGGTYQFVIDTSYSKCTGLCLNKVMISNFPWRENFDGAEWVPGVGNGNSGTTHRGDIPPASSGWNWIPGNSIDYGWSVRTGTTFTPSTGPLGDASPGGQGNYLYTEFSPAVGLVITLFTTPCIDLRDSVSRTFTFDYHMYGADIQHLRLDVDTGLGVSAWHINLARLQGEQQMSSSDPWKKYTVDLSPYAGRIIKLRFSSLASTSAKKRDVAIDNLEIKATAPTDAGLIDIVTSLGSPCAAATNVNLNVNVVNYGTSVLNQIPVAYQLDNNAIVRDTIQGASLSTLDTAGFTFSQPLSFNGNVAHILKVWAEVHLDTAGTNDTVTIDIPVKNGSVISTFPYFMGFEAAIATGQGGTVNLGTADWTVKHQANNRWVVEEYSSNDYAEGPALGEGLQGKFLIMDQSVTTYDSVVLRSSCIDLSPLTNPQLSFKYVLKNGSSFAVLIRSEESPWQLLDEPGPSPFSLSKILSQYAIDLTPYSGKTVEIMFLNEMNSPGTLLAIDDIVISENNITDLSVRGINDGVTRQLAGMDSINTVTIEYARTGSPGYFNAAINLRFTDICNPSAAPITAQESFFTGGGVVRDHSKSFSNVALSAPLAAGEYELKIWLTTAGDVIPQNDTLTLRATVSPTLPVPYFNNFENCEILFRDNGGFDQWEVLAPTGGAHSGQKAFTTNNFTALPGTHYLMPPFFEGMDTLAGVVLRFWHRYDFINTNEYGQVEYFMNGSWQPLYNGSITGTNWDEQFSGSSPWVFSSFPLDQAVSPSGQAVLRFKAEITSTDSSGWAIDDFEIFVPPQNSAAPRLLSFDNGLPASGDNTLSITLENTGAKPLDSVDFYIEANGTVVINQQVHLNNLLPGQKRTVILQQPLNLTAPNTALRIYTSRPNSRMDAIPGDDTITMNIQLLPELNTLPYCNDFETTAGMVSFNEKLLQPDTSWTYGTPSKTSINGAHSGNKSWYIGSENSYGPLLNSYLYTAPIHVEDDKCYRFSFFHFFDTETNFDGGNVEYSLDTGATWQILGKYGDSTWYNTPFIQSSSQVNPGFSGSSGGWVPAFQDIEIVEKGQIRFRFRFTSDYEINADGWAIDDICFEETGTSCSDVSLAGYPLEGEYLSLYPNPAHEELSILLGKSAAGAGGIVKLTIIDQSGKTIRAWEQHSNIKGEYIVDIAPLPAGVYAIQVELNGELHTKKFVKY